MRDIKFRGKRIDNGKWVYGNLFQSSGRINSGFCYICEDLTSIELDDEFRCVNLGGFYPVDPETVGDFTGLLDKNGREIFEGDLITSNGVKKYLYRVETGIHPTKDLEYSYAIFKVEVKMLCGVYGVEVKSNKPCFIPLVPGDEENVKNIEVVGNIYESPELLKGDNK